MDTVFGLYASQKNWDMKLKSGMPGDLIYVCLQLVFRFWKFQKKLISPKVVLGGGAQINFLKSEIAILKSSSPCVFYCFSFVFGLILYFWRFFNIYKFSVKNIMAMGHLNRYS